MMNKELTIKNLLLKYKNILKNEGIKTYSIDCELLLMKVLNIDKVKLYTNLDYCISNDSYKIFVNYIKRRLNREPVQYIINTCWFMGLRFFVDKSVLIPREDTEILVEKTINIINNNKLKNILEIGTGSGIISISLAKYCKDIQITAIDISAKALNIAQKNACLIDVGEKINFIKSNLFENLKSKNLFDIIISNPPYIKTSDIKLLDKNVKDFEPLIALDGGIDGLNFYNKITYNAKNFLNPKGYLIYEIGFDQAKDVYNILFKNNFYDIKVLKDLKKLDRVIVGKLK